jgi:F-type H+-transporting ATPase subunit delta
MADFETAARPYAKAMFELAQDEGKLDQWQEKLSLAAAIAVDPDMGAFLEQPDVLPRELGELFLSVVAGAGLDSDANFDNAIRLLAENSRLAALPAIAGQFETLKREAASEARRSSLPISRTRLPKAWPNGSARKSAFPLKSTTA